MSAHVVCHDCTRTIAAGNPRIVVTIQEGELDPHSYYVCGDCAYYRDMDRPNPKVKPDDAKKA